MTLLDTNICVPLLNGSDRGLIKRFDAANEDLSLCSVVKAELLFGARSSARVSANLSQLAQFFARLPSVPFDDAASHHYGLWATTSTAWTPGQRSAAVRYAGSARLRVTSVTS